MVSSNEWVLISSEGSEVYHKDYGDNTHGLVFVDENGKGNAVLVDDCDNVLDIEVLDVTDLFFLQSRCNLMWDSPESMTL